MSEIDLKKYNIRTDLIVDIYKEETKTKNITIRKKIIDDILVVNVNVKRDDNELGKKKGRYTTISFRDVTDTKNYKKTSRVLVKSIKEMMKYLGITHEMKCLVVGLGNRNSTPDALGPKVIDSILITKYLYDIKEIDVDRSFGNVSSLTPGVLANTGIETSDVIKGIVNESKPDYLIVIDALASSSMERINKTIQITDTGISPGSGIGNNRKEISREVLGIPVISIGIPTVIEAIVLVSDTIKYITKYFSKIKDTNHPRIEEDYRHQEDLLTEVEKKEILGEVGLLDEEKTKSLIFEVLTPLDYNMMVTPKEIDFLIDRLAKLIADAINMTLHKNFDKKAKT